MNILDRYILFSYVKRLLSVFVILMLIFIIQTIWLFIDELAGKGIGIDIILKFLLYYTPKLIPLVLPLSVLLASIMTYGTFAENYEFAAMKSTGISLQRALRGLIFFHLLLAIGTFYFANNIIPLAEIKSINLRRNLAKLKPTLAITEGIFNDIGEINIKVAEKYGENDRFLRDVTIHEKTPDEINNIVLKAAKGELQSGSNIGNELQLVLFDGHRYEEIIPEKLRDRERILHARVSFDKYIMNIDLSQFNNVDLSQEDYKTFYRMQKVDQLSESIDSLAIQYKNLREAFANNFSRVNGFGVLNPAETDSIFNDSIVKYFKNPLQFLSDEQYYRHGQVINNASQSITGIINTLDGRKKIYFIQQKLVNLHINTLNGKYTIGFGVFFLFLIGATLGAIIKKGGLGIPVVLAIIIFLFYHFIGMFAENASEDGSISPVFGSWVSVIVVGIFAFYLTRQATRDLKILNLDRIQVPIIYFIEKVKKSIKTKE